MDPGDSGRYYRCSIFLVSDADWYIRGLYALSACRENAIADEKGIFTAGKRGLLPS